MKGAIWLASYPRSGNTWTRLALRSLQGGGEAIDLDDIYGFSPMGTRRELLDTWLEAETSHLTDTEIDELRPDFHATFFGQAPAPLPSKVHDAWLRTRSGRPIFDAAATWATIYLVRDPRDVAVSWARFVGISHDAAIAFLGNPEAALDARDGRIAQQVRQKMGTWSTHVTSWIDESGLAPLVIRYEDMLADPAAAYRLMLERIGWQANDAQIADAIAATRFERLADKEKRHGFLERAAQTDRFFASGRSGNWRDKLTHAQVARIEHDHGPVMARFGYL